MSDTKSTMNRRDLLVGIAFSTAGAAVLGPSMYRVLEDTVVELRTQEAYPTPEGNPKHLTRQSLKNEIRAAYQNEEGGTTQRLSTILGAVIGYVSYDKVRAKAQERSPDIY